jgi:anti-anti-sigma factor
MLTPSERKHPLKGAAFPDAFIGDHFCWSYDDESAFDEAVTSFTIKGLDQSQRVAIFLPAESAARTRSFISQNVVGFDQALSLGALIIGDFADAYLPGNRFDADARVSGFRNMIADSAREGYRALRVFGETTGIFEHPEGKLGWPAYELRADLLLSTTPAIGVCAFDASRTSAADLAVIHGLHPSRDGHFPRESFFQLHASRGGGLRLAGELDAATAETIQRATTCAAKDLMYPHVDVGSLSFVDVAGMRALTAGFRAIGRRHSKVQVCGASPTFARLWNLLGCENEVGTEVAFA